MALERSCTDMTTRSSAPRRLRLWLNVAGALFIAATVGAAQDSTPQVGLAVRDITPDSPIRLAGYASRNRPSEKADQPIVAQAVALKNPSGERFVFVALDNCGVSHAFMQPVRQQCADRFQLGPGAVAVVCSHTHSAPVLEHTLTAMYQPTPAEHERIVEYSGWLRAQIVELVGAALADCQPALLEQGLGRATFAMNRRVYQGDRVVMSENPDGPVDWDVPVLRVKGTNGAVRAIVFGYACHGTSIATGEEFYQVSGDYMGYARQHLEAHQPGALAVFLTGMGGDANPSPRQGLLDAKRHGLELAGAVIGVLDRPMRPVRGAFKLAYTEVELPFVGVPTREQLEKDAHSDNVYMRQRAEAYLKLPEAGQPLPKSVHLPLAALRLGDDLTFVLMGGEVVVDYARRIKRVFAEDHPWTIGYAYEVPCYIPSARLLLEGGYEVNDSLIYYGYYGPFQGGIEARLLTRLEALMHGLRGKSR
jgi:neutral ceramidase